MADIIDIKRQGIGTRKKPKNSELHTIERKIEDHNAKMRAQAREQNLRKVNVLSPRHEHFCQEYVKTRNGTKSYLAAYGDGRMKDAQAARGAWRLLKLEKVQERLAQIQEQSAKAAGITLERLTHMCQEAYELAVKTRDARGAAMAIAQISKMHGFDAAARDNQRNAVGEALKLLEERRAAREADSKESA